MFGVGSAFVRTKTVGRPSIVIMRFAASLK